MNQQVEAMKLALEALEHLQPTALTSFYTIGNRNKAITALQKALAQPQQEPVAYFETITGRIAVRDDTHRRKFPMCYRPLVFGDTSPPAQSTWVGLTDEEVADIISLNYPAYFDIAQAIEAKLKEKNT